MEIRINYKGIEFDVEYDYQPYEKQVFYYADGTGDPGCPEMVEAINEFKHKGTCFLEWIEDEEDEVIEAILKEMHDQ
jgi:hypothetical protein